MQELIYYLIIKNSEYLNLYAKKELTMSLDKFVFISLHYQHTFSLKTQNMILIKPDHT